MDTVINCVAIIYVIRFIGVDARGHRVMKKLVYLNILIFFIVISHFSSSKFVFLYDFMKSTPSIYQNNFIYFWLVREI